MPTTRIRIAVESEAEAFVRLNEEEVELNANGVARAEVEVDAKTQLVFALVGDPGAEYTVTVDAVSPSFEIKFTKGKSPTEGRIPNNDQRTGGVLRFRAIRKSEE